MEAPVVPAGTGGWPLPPPQVIDLLNIRVDGYLGGRANKHWLVTSSNRALVLRCYQHEPIGDIGYELRVLHRLDRLGWPTPVAVTDPRSNGRPWSWVFLGVAAEIRKMVSGAIPPHRLEWQTRMLLRRSPFMGPHRAPYAEWRDVTPSHLWNPWAEPG
jgi:hypothetical protein